MIQRDALYVKAVFERTDNNWTNYKTLRNFVVNKIKIEKGDGNNYGKT